jgi:hypothetical protein
MGAANGVPPLGLRMPDRKFTLSGGTCVRERRFLHTHRRESRFWRNSLAPSRRRPRSQYKHYRPKLFLNE